MSTALTGTSPRLLRPGDPDYDRARQAWNLVIDQRPDAVALPGSAAEVADAVRYAASLGLRVAAQGTGHSAALLGDLSGTLLLRTDRMRAVRIDPVARVARAEAGVVWLDVVRAAAGHGLATLSGSSPDVGVVGYTLGGGLSFLGRKYGFAANNVAAVELVTADGTLVRADAEHEPDLFWALRGGGGSFGVVTAIEFRLFPLTHAYAGHLWYPAERGPEVLHAWSELTHGEVPDELTTVGRYLNLPPIPDIPEDIRGKSFVIVEACHVGEPAAADQVLAPLRALGPVNDTIALMPMPAVSHLHMDPERPVPGAGDGMTLDDLPPAATDAFIRAAGPGAPLPLLSVEIRHLGGELGRPRPGNGALASLDAGYLLYAVSMTPAPELVPPVLERVEAVKEALTPWAARQMFFNFADTRMCRAPMWPDDTFRRLREIKAKTDPGGMIRANRPIPPAH
jgi:hypothetical protein